MKKFLALFLVLVMAFSCVLVSCNKNNEDPEGTSDEDDDFIGLGTGLGTGTGTGTGNGNLPAQTGNTHTDFTWTDDTNETLVYVMVGRLNVRSDTNTSSETYKATALFGESFKRIRYNAEWTQIDYNGSQYYVSSDYVTTDDGYVSFTNDTEESTVYVISEALNLRSGTYIFDGYDNLVVNLKKGDQLTRVATSKNGKWIKVKYQGTDKLYEGYCNASYVSTNPNATPDLNASGPSAG